MLQHGKMYRLTEPGKNDRLDHFTGKFLSEALLFAEHGEKMLSDKDLPVHV